MNERLSRTAVLFTLLSVCVANAFSPELFINGGSVVLEIDDIGFWSSAPLDVMSVYVTETPSEPLSCYRTLNHRAITCGPDQVCANSTLFTKDGTYSSYRCTNRETCEANDVSVNGCVRAADAILCCCDSDCCNLPSGNCSNPNAQPQSLHSQVQTVIFSEKSTSEPTPEKPLLSCYYSALDSNHQCAVDEVCSNTTLYGDGVHTAYRCQQPKVCSSNDVSMGSCVRELDVTICCCSSNQCNRPHSDSTTTSPASTTSSTSPGTIASSTNQESTTKATSPSASPTQSQSTSTVNSSPGSSQSPQSTSTSKPSESSTSSSTMIVTSTTSHSETPSSTPETSESTSTTPYPPTDSTSGVESTSTSSPTAQPPTQSTATPISTDSQTPPISTTTTSATSPLPTGSLAVFSIVLSLLCM